MTYNCATMEVSPAVYDEILGKLKAAGYEHAIGKDGMLDMTHLGLERGPVPEGDTPRTDAASWSDSGGGKKVDIEFARTLERELTIARADGAELQSGFNLRWKADMRAIKHWQEATGKHDTFPDHADLCVWLLEQGAADQVDAARYRGWRALWCTPGDSGLEILNQHIGTGGGEAEHDTGIDAAIAERRAKCRHRWFAYHCQDCGAPALCVIGEADEE